MQRASSSVNVMNGMLGKLAATAGAAFSINQVKNYADSYTGMVNKLKLVTSTQSELSRAMDDTHKNCTGHSFRLEWGFGYLKIPGLKDD